MIWYLAVGIGCFVLGWLISIPVTRSSLLREVAEMEQKKRNTEMWMEFIKAQGGNA